MAQKISVQIVGDEKDLRRAFRSAEDSSKSFAEKFRRDGEIITTWAKRGAQAIGALVATVVGISLKGGVDRLMGLERASKQLDQLGVSATAADGLMDSLLGTLRGTPFALDAGAKSLAGFVASGRELDDIPRLVQQVTDAAAFGNTTLEEVDFLWQRIQTTGRVTNEELRMLAERNIPVYQQLAGAIGVGADEVFDMAQRGEISADMFFDAWQRAAEGTEDGTVRIAGAAQAMGETTEGAWGNMRTAMSRFGTTLLEDVFPLAKDVFNAIGDGFDRMGEVVSEAFDNVDTSGLEDVIARIPEMMESATESVIDFWQETQVLRNVAGTAIRGVKEVIDTVPPSLALVGIALAALYAHPVIAGLALVATAIGWAAEQADETRDKIDDLAQSILDMNTEAAEAAARDLFTAEELGFLESIGFGMERLTTDAGAYADALEVLRDRTADWRAGSERLAVDVDGLRFTLERVTGASDDYRKVKDEERSTHLETAEAQHRAEAAAIALGEAEVGAAEDTRELTEAEEAAAEAAAEYEEALDSLTGATERSFSDMASDVEGFIDGFSELPEEADVSMAEFETNIRERTEAMQRFWSGLGELASLGLDGLVDELIRQGPSAVDVVEEYVADPSRAMIMNSYIEGAEEGLVEAQKVIAGQPDIDGPNINFGANLPTFTWPSNLTPGKAVVPERGPDRQFNPQAKGGIVKARPGGTLFQRGEAGDDEAVIPLNGEGIRILAEVFKKALGGSPNGQPSVVHHHEWNIESSGNDDDTAQKAGSVYSIVRRMETL